MAERKFGMDTIVWCNQCRIFAYIMEKYINLVTDWHYSVTRHRIESGQSKTDILMVKNFTQIDPSLFKTASLD